MRTVTRCPSCETQFFVTEVQLNKHDGKVRCGQCMHVFNAKDHFIDTTDSPAPIATVEAEQPNAEPAIESSSVINDTTDTTDRVDTATAITSDVASDAPTDMPLDTSDDINSNTASDSSSNITEYTPENSPSENGWPAINNQLLDDEPSPFHETEHIAEQITISASNEEIDAFSADVSTASTPSVPDSSLDDDTNDRILLDNDDLANLAKSEHQQQAQALNDITKLTFVADNQGNYFEDLAKSAKRSKSSQKSSKNSSGKSLRWPWFLGAILLILAALAQSIYYLRNDIAIYYPNSKPYLMQACQQLNCTINLPQQIELILIDDSDMQEDEKYAGLMNFSSSLINKAGFIQAYPNIELTLTDTDDNPVLRRLFKPSEYLSAKKDIAAGLQAGEHVKIKLAITTQDIPVAGYRVYITY